MASAAKTSGDKKKSKKSGEATSRSKDKERKSKSKDRKSSSKREKPVAAPAPIVSASVTPPPVVHDPDAIQLFRRYDRNRSGVLTRLDFLQLLRDYADPTSSGWGISLSRPPLSLTDSSGIPLGYQRADRNSEFEAGQLFERYDRDHTGALTLDTFHVFFADFKPQLRAFVEETNYRALAPPPLEPVHEEKAEPVSTNAQDAATDADTPPSPRAIRVKYRAALWKLRKICKDELFDQRERLVQHMKVIREDMTHRQQRSSRNGSCTRRTKRRPRASHLPGFGDDEIYTEDTPEKDETKQYEAMEDDLDRLDELIGYVRRHLNKGSDVSQREMQSFLEQAEGIEEEAECLAMKDYGDIPPSKKENEPSALNSSPPAPTSAPVQPASLPSSQHQKQTELERLLRVKDQMIYQLLQERTAMRKERAAVEASLKKLSDVSTREMKKWARLTDEMQAEIEQLRRSQSHQRGIKERGQEASGNKYT
ncbi:hypothetical protein PC129_g4860 [Phytophthora cactorum]|uniref:EF-hand domain-containing protein n=1 Tax=Phytophthora cactorum TaxID=29920 RepID=A0A329SAP3_9STRA|nr:hypothetical protein Pcac1_g18266 [Phytophthora cactorum]KAG2838533.1 hypothetical protein PC111_g4193 [Phytophthora cactorum]KAG2844228.1 hypothetical protein PC112_g2306 [Phytophthora cactorum]KAG2864170.1 hypothetical protein PC113_g4809 [Phytophthora cactorum]KAG2919741.1 hypothetical protein PC114_g6348 [Phytophthora cactorum]